MALRSSQCLSLVHWADEPFPLVTLPSKRPEYANDTHSCVWAATLMAEVHNVLIRGLNAIVQQGPYVKRFPSHNPSGYKKKDVQDFLVYVTNWVTTVNQHHHIEESFVFPEIDKFVGIKGYMDDPKHEHARFHDGISNLLVYAQETSHSRYKWEGQGGMKEIIDGFSNALVDHLYSEIDVFLRMREFDSDGFRKVVKRSDAQARKHGDLGIVLYQVFPCFLGCHDKTYAGGTDFPGFPWILPYMIKYWFAAWNGAWRFNPCDFWGRPRPLAFGPMYGLQVEHSDTG